MLTLEQYRNPDMGRLYDQYLAGGPVGYMKNLFAGMIENPEDAMQLALSFYGPVFILYSIYDGGDR